MFVTEVKGPLSSSLFQVQVMQEAVRQVAESAKETSSIGTRHVAR